MYQHFLHSCLRSKAHAQGKKHFSFMVQDMVATKKSPHKTDTMCSFPLSLSFSHMWAFVYISNTCERRSIGKKGPATATVCGFFFHFIRLFFFVVYVTRSRALRTTLFPTFLFSPHIFIIYIYIYIHNPCETQHVSHTMYIYIGAYDFALLSLTYND